MEFDIVWRRLLDSSTGSRKIPTIILAAAAFGLLVIYINGLGQGEANNSDDEIRWDRLHGTNFLSPVLTTRENSSTIGYWPSDYETRSMKIIVDNKLNFVRVIMQWESYERDPNAFLNQAENIARIAEANEIKVIYDNHHWFASSYLDTVATGFPEKVVISYRPAIPFDYETDPEIRRFWNDLWNNTAVIKDTGQKVWDAQAEYLVKVIQRVDKYSSVIGYEILNEPHVWDRSQYAKLGEYNTYIAKELRQHTDKAILFDRETAHGGFVRQPLLEPSIVPVNITNIVYAPHIYSVPYAGEQAEQQIKRFVQWSIDWNVPVLIGEFSAANQQQADVFISAFKTNGFGWAYWAWGCFYCDADQRLVERDMNTTSSWNHLKQSLESNYYS